MLIFFVLFFHVAIWNVICLAGVFPESIGYPKQFLFLHFLMPIRCMVVDSLGATGAVSLESDLGLPTPELYKSLDQVWIESILHFLVRWQFGSRVT